MTIFDLFYLFSGIFAVILFFISNNYDVYNATQKKTINFFIIAISFILLSGLFGLFYFILKQPREWDFLCFYLDSKVAVNNLDFYDSKNYSLILSQLNLPIIPTKGFIIEIVNVGFKYPPATMFLFLPLGYFNFNEARLLWLVISFLFFILDVYLIWKLFFYFNKKIGLYLSFLILVILSASFTTFTLGQTLFIALFFLMLYWRKQNSNLSGLWIALSILVKPFFGIILIFLLIRKKWKVLFSSLLSLTALLFLSIIVFGYSTFIHYFTHITHIDVPNWQYTGLENQSLLATLIRNFGHDFTASSPLLNIYYIIIAAVISILTFSIIYFLPKDKNEIGIAFIVSLALLIYPGSLNIYGVVLLPGILFLNLKKKELSISNLLLLTYILLFFSLMRFQAFISYLITWILLLIVGIKIVVPLLTKLNSKNV